MHIGTDFLPCLRLSQSLQDSIRSALMHPARKENNHCRAGRNVRMRVEGYIKAPPPRFVHYR